jgi:hypothetical protein
MLTYTTLDGRVLDLSNLSEPERAYFDHCYTAYHAGMRWDEFVPLAGGAANPLVRATGGRITEAVWTHPLYRAVRDLEARLGVRQGEIAPSPGDDVERDPIEDEWLSVAEAAARKGVTVQGLHEAIKRGAVLATAARPGTTRRVVSRNSVERWSPVVVRQAAGRAAARARLQSAAVG